MTFIVGFILFFDELWMFGIPLGHILPDMTDFHIEGMHHWMLGVFLMVLVGISYLFSIINNQFEKKWNYKVTDEQKGLLIAGFLLMVVISILISFSVVNFMENSTISFVH
jgi:hypothetical protein